MLKPVAPLKQYGLQAAMNDGAPEAAVIIKGSLEVINPILIAIAGPVYVPNIDITIGAQGVHVYALLSTHYSHACSTHSQTYMSCALCMYCASGRILQLHASCLEHFHLSRIQHDNRQSSFPSITRRTASFW